MIRVVPEDGVEDIQDVRITVLLDSFTTSNRPLGIYRGPTGQPAARLVNLVKARHAAPDHHRRGTGLDQVQVRQVHGVRERDRARSTDAGQIRSRDRAVDPDRPLPGADVVDPQARDCAVQEDILLPGEVDCGGVDLQEVTVLRLADGAGEVLASSQLRQGDRGLIQPEQDAVRTVVDVDRVGAYRDSGVRPVARGVPVVGAVLAVVTTRT